MGQDLVCVNYESIWRCKRYSRRPVPIAFDRGLLAPLSEVSCFRPIAIYRQASRRRKDTSRRLLSPLRNESAAVRGS